MGYWILLNDPKKWSLDVIDAGQAVKYYRCCIVNRDVEEEGNFDNIQSGDIILGYAMNPIYGIRDIFQLVGKPSGKDGKPCLELKKLLSFSEIISADELKAIGVVPEDPVNSIIPISKEQCLKVIEIINKKNELLEARIAPPRQPPEENVPAKGNEIKQDDNLPRNWIFYGAPGTGKSYDLEELRKKYFAENFNYKRITFHAAYSYTQFMGSYKPAPIYSVNAAENIEWFGQDGSPDPSGRRPHIDYRVVSGPFLEVLCRALIYTKHNFVLIVEEINRADAAAVFGDVFQLLDRDSSGKSEYGVKLSKELTDYVYAQGIKEGDCFSEKERWIRIPANMYLWATMNSADQGVTRLDTAFKRRWSFKYISIDNNAKIVMSRKISFPKNGGGTIEYNWNDFRKNINEKLRGQKMRIPEDKLIGPFFMNEADLKDPTVVVNKLFLYIKDDVLRHNPEVLFKETHFSKIVENYNKGVDVFHNQNELFQPAP